MENIEEGNVEIEVHEGRSYDKEVFYNPRMEFDRNLSVAIVSVVGPRKACDALSASGIRGIRYKKEAGIPEVWLNDANLKASRLIQSNMEKNSLCGKIRNKDAAVLLRQENFDFIDIDPFGSPAEFLDAAASSIKSKGLIGVTATDTSSFFGTYPRVSRRRYGRKSMKTGYNKELGLRILVSAIIESLGRYKKTFYPKLCYFREHYARVFGEIVSGAKEVQENFRNFGHISHCFSCGWRNQGFHKNCDSCGSQTEVTNVYTGRLNNPNFCRNVAEKCKSKGFDEEHDMVDRLSDDMDIPYHYDLHYIAKKQSIPVNKTQETIQRLRDSNHKTKKSVYSPTAVKTEAPFHKVVETMI